MTVTEYADIEDVAGNIIGQIDVASMRVLAPNYAVDEAIAAGAAIYMCRNGIRSILSVDKPKGRRRK